jgi:hypothetical protein
LIEAKATSFRFGLWREVMARPLTTAEEAVVQAHRRHADVLLDVLEIGHASQSNDALRAGEQIGPRLDSNPAGGT